MAQKNSALGLLRRTSLFGALQEADLLAVARKMRSAIFEVGQVVFTHGSPGRAIYLVVDGRVRLSVISPEGRLLTFRYAGAGEIFGEIAALDGGLRSADATATTKVETLTLDQIELNRLLQTNDRIARAAINWLCSKLRETSYQGETIALYPIEVRLARFLLSALKLQNADSKTPIDIAMSQSELGQLIGASRQKVNAALTILEDSGAVKRVGKKFACDSAKLTAIAAPI